MNEYSPKTTLLVLAAMSMAPLHGASFIATLDEVAGRASFNTIINGGTSYSDAASGGVPNAFGATTDLGNATTEGIAFSTRSNGTIGYSVFDVQVDTAGTAISPDLVGVLTSAGYSSNTILTYTNSSNRYLTGSGAVGYSPTAAIDDGVTNSIISAFSLFQREQSVNQTGGMSTDGFGFDSSNTNPNDPNASNNRREGLVIQFDQPVGHWGADMLDFESRRWTSGVPSGVTAEFRTYLNGSPVDTLTLDYQDLGVNYTGYAGDGNNTFIGYYAEDATEAFDTIVLIVGGETAGAADSNRWAFGNSVFGPAAEGGVNIPEPSAMLLAALGGMAALSRRRRA